MLSKAEREERERYQEALSRIRGAALTIGCTNAARHRSSEDAVWSESVKALEAIADRAEAMATEAEHAAELEKEQKTS
jgi:hypothetical protein